MIDKTILHYKILEKLGEGGMGVVYKARDTKLDREVALKFLPANSITSEDEKTRFEQEAKAAAKLSHANIATVFEINEHEGETFIAMEYVDGETLADRIEKGPLPLKDAIKLATQIAEGLQAAHEKNITHRDIKSQNIMLTDKGTVKIMDFGLAKLSGRTKVTKEGTTLGTTAYMSPEQARGESADHRSDIWSFGVVLYEMIAGQLPFKGDYEQATLYSVMNDDPESLTGLRAGVPLAFDDIIGKMLAKEAQDRYQHVDEVPVDLRKIDLGSTGSSRIATTRAMPAALHGGAVPPTSWGKLGGLAIIIAAIAGAVGWFLKPEPSAPTPMVARVSILADSSSRANNTTISPDGLFIAYNHAGRIYLRRLDQERSNPIAGTEGGSGPFFSPDSRWLGFHAGDKGIQKVLIAGGSPIPVADFKRATFGTWGPNDTVIFSTYGGGLYRVSALGGTPELIIEPDTSKGEFSYASSSFLPDGESILLEIGYGSRWSDSTAVAVLNLNSKVYKIIMKDAWRPRYSPTGHLIWMRWFEQQLLAAPYDLENQILTGSAVPITQGLGSYAFSSNGSLVHNTGFAVRGEQVLVWLDKQGQETTISPTKAPFYHNAFLSPDGKKISLVRGTDVDRADIFVYDLDLDKFDQLTFQGQNDDPCWTPDGEYITYISRHDDRSSLLVQKADGSTAAKKIWEGQTIDHPHWSPDGKWLAFAVNYPDDKTGIWVYSTAQDSVINLTPSDASERAPRFSPDGKWIAFYSRDGESSGIFVKPFPDTGGRWRISESGGRNPIWSRDGKMIYYRGQNRGKDDLLGIKVQTEPVFAKLGSPEVIFNKADIVEINDVHPDGDRFLAVLRERTETGNQNEIRMVLNWFEELKRLAPAGR